MCARVVTSFAEELRRESEPLWQQIVEHPFLVEIEQGKLPIEKYRLYAIQNSHYFFQWFRASAAAMMRAPTPEDCYLIASTLAGYYEEWNRYKAMIMAAGVTEEQIRTVVPLPANAAYGDFMLRVALTGSLEEFACAVVSCPWTYADAELNGISCAARVARGLMEHYGVPRALAQPYLENFRGEAHRRSLELWKALISRKAEQATAEELERRRLYFRMGTEFEYKFWDMAYYGTLAGERELGSYY